MAQPDGLTGPFAPPVELRDPFCLRDSGIVTWGAFLEDVGRTATAIGGHDAICNMAVGRYEFAVLLAAALLNGQTSVLPPARAERTVAASLVGWHRPLLVERLGSLPVTPPAEPPEALFARLPAATGQVMVFTSGSTGEPIRHTKSWVALAGGAQLTDQLISEAGLERGSGLVVGTTPSQHMYGLEAAIFSGLAFGHCLCDLPVFHPGDLDVLGVRLRAAGLDQVTLMTSPPHLRFLEETVRQHPEIRCLISATAPLHAEIARRVEGGGQCRVLEIYGSTETGSMAWRSSADMDRWTLLPGFHIAPGEDGWTATAPHLAGPVALADEIAICEDGRFVLRGRQGDMVSVAGKRQSLGALNAALSAMPGLRDGVFVRDTVDGEDRLTLVLVAEPRSRAERDQLIADVRRHLRAHVDPVFVPRRVHIVSSLPRGETGKISARVLERLVAAAH